MFAQLAHLFTRKLMLAALGAALVVGAGTTAALAAAGNRAQATHTAQGTQGQLTQGRSHDGADDADDNDDDSRGANQNGQNGQQRQIEGAIRSLDAGKSSFVVASEHSGAVTVVVDGKTAFDSGISGFADLKVGMFVEVNGNFVTDTRLTATKIERGNDGNDTATGASGATGSDDPVGDDHGGDSGRSGSSGGSGGSGRGGHDDGVSHH